MTEEAFIALLRAQESWLTERVLHYARERGFVRDTSTLLEAWRLSITGLTEALADEMARFGVEGVEITVDTSRNDDPLARFAVGEARRHRERGVTLGMFMGLFVYYRQAYQDLVREFVPSGHERVCLEDRVVRLFDRMGTAFCVEWSNLGGQQEHEALSSSLRHMVNEKNRYLTFFESLSLPALMIDETGRIDNANTAAARLLDAMARPGQSYYTVRPGDGPGPRGQALGEIFPWLMDIVNEAMSSQESVVARNVEFSRLSQTLIFRAVASRPPDVSGKFTGLSLVLFDVTEDKIKESLIIRAKQELERTFDTISDLVFLVDDAGVILRVNKSLSGRLGVTPRELIGQPCQEVFGCAGCLSLGQCCTTDGSPVTFGRLQGKFLVNRNILRGVQGEPYGSVFVARDVTMMERIQSTLQAIEGKYKSIFDNAAEGIFQSTLEGRYLSVNPAMARMFGFESSQEMLEYYFDIGQQMYVDPNDRAAMMKEGLDTGEIRSREVQLRRKDGSVFWAILNGRLVKDTKGRFFEGFVQDVTNRKHLESQLLQTQKLEAIGQLAAGIAHEINTPTQYVLNNMWFIKEAIEEIHAAMERHQELFALVEAQTPLAAETLAVRKQDVDQQIGFYLQELPVAISETLQGLERITSIVRSVRQFAHPGHENKQSVNLNELVTNTVTLSRNEWKYVAELSTDLDPDLPPVRCHVHEIGQVFLNLVVNAAHAIIAARGEDGVTKGSILISTRRQEDWVEIRVQDSGTGIPPDVQARIFEPFFTTKPVGTGTGQGLFIAHRSVVGNHGGTIGFETTPGQGTTFVVRLPLAEKSMEGEYA
jgi:PAS domain S-box-containing protein